MSKIKKNYSQILLLISLLLLCIIMILPFIWMFSTSLRLPKDSFKMPPSFFPTNFYYKNYVEVFSRFPFLKFIGNSFFVSITAGIGNILITTMAAFAFARLTFKGRNTIFFIFLTGLMIPAQATMIPTFIIISKMHLVGSLWALILPTLVSPFSIFLVRQFMMTIPNSYEEAAYMDGASRFTIYHKIILPMSKSVIIMTTLFNFLGTWNNFMGPLIYLSDWDKMTLPVGLRLLQGYQGSGSLSVILAGLTISLIPPLLLYFFGQKHLVQGATLSGVKA